MSGKSITTWALAILVAGAAFFAMNRQSAIAKVRAENEAMMPASKEALQLLNENQQIEQLRADNLEVKRLEAANGELPRLRNEAMQLRHQMEALNRLKAENEDLANRLANKPAANLDETAAQGRQIMGSVFAREELRDVGTGFPRATLQTFFWALSTGNMQRARECFAPEVATTLANVPDEQLQQQVSQNMGSFTGYEILGRKDSPDEIDLTVKVDPSGETQEMRFKNLGTDWKLMR